MLRALIRPFGGGPVGLSTLAVAVGEQPDTVEEVCEPFLLRAGLLARTPRGRVATAACVAASRAAPLPLVPSVAGATQGDIAANARSVQLGAVASRLS